MAVERIALKMDELPMPYLFDIKAACPLSNSELIEYIQRVEVEIYRNT